VFSGLKREQKGGNFEMHYDLFIVDHFWNATVGHSVEDLPIKNFTNSFI